MSERAAHPYAELTPDLVMNAIESLGYQCDARILMLNSYENRVYQIGIEEGEPLVGKFYRPGRWSDEQILEEHRFTRELAELEITAVPPLELPSGNTLEYYEGYRFALYARYGGRAPDLEATANLPILGRYLARIHAAGASAPFRYRPEFSIESFGTESREFLLGHDFIPDELVAAYDSLTQALLERIEQRFRETPRFERIRLHGDCHRGNVLWRDEIPHFVDFDDARSGPAIQDLWMLLSGEREERQIQLRKIVDGYEEFYRFNPVELNLVEALRTLRMMHYAAWIARRWEDPAFPAAFPFFNSMRYWSNHVLELREQLAELDEPPLELY